MTWQLEAEHADAHDLLEELEPLALSLFGAHVLALFASREEAERARRHVETHLGFAPCLRELPARDWVAENIRSFPPFVVGPFTIVHGDHPAMTGTILIRMKAGAGFGTGEHPSTAGCLQALAALDTPPGTVLDMGCGSAILSIAALRLWDCDIIAVDNDPLALAFAQGQIEANEITGRIHLVCAHAFSAFSSQPFDLVIANILARPLIDMAGAVNATTVILSGFLEHQSAPVLDAYRQAGYAPRATTIINDWTTLTLARDPAVHAHGATVADANSAGTSVHRGATPG